MLITCHVCFRVIPESLRWLIINKKYKRAESVLQHMAKYNQVSLPEDPLGRKSNTLLIISTSPTDDNIATRENGDAAAEEEASKEKREEVEVHLQEEDREGKEESQELRKYSLLDMCRTPRLRERTLLFCYIWFAPSHYAA